MKEYFSHLILYTKYFFKVLLNNKIALIFTVLFPCVMVIINLNSPTLPEIKTTLVFWLGYLVMINALTSITEVLTLREQGYLKQYKTIVRHISIFLWSKAFVNWVNLTLTSCAIIIFTCIYLNVSPFRVLFLIIPICTLLYLLLIGGFSFLLILPLNQKNISILITLIIVAMTMISNNLEVFSKSYISFFLVNLLDPLILMNTIYQMLNNEISTKLLYSIIIPIFVIFLVIGWIFIPKTRILPSKE
ncbi:hypothetical protein [Aerococcus urinaeequi]|uniref:hypothetical protein n=1 Tax=Aerococcus urinaeequi TaxID=51665 RepID=UPI003D6BACA7